MCQVIHRAGVTTAWEMSASTRAMMLTVMVVTTVMAVMAVVIPSPRMMVMAVMAVVTVMTAMTVLTLVMAMTRQDTYPMRQLVTGYARSLVEAERA